MRWNHRKLMHRGCWPAKIAWMMAGCSRRVYFVINNVTLHRLPDGLPVPVFNLSLSLDAASWT